MSVEGFKGVLVYCDGRTTALDNCNASEWWVQAREHDYSKRRFFKLADVARQIPDPQHPVLVYTERPMADYESRTR